MRISLHATGTTDSQVTQGETGMLFYKDAKRCLLLAQGFPAVRNRYFPYFFWCSGGLTVLLIFFLTVKKFCTFTYFINITLLLYFYIFNTFYIFYTEQFC